MTLRYFILKLENEQKAKEFLIEAGWADDVNSDEFIIAPPAWTDLIETKAYDEIAVYTENGEIESESILSSGVWLMGSIQNEELPELIESKIVSMWEFNELMVLPTGVKQISPILSGVTL